MGILDSIQSARSSGASDDQIVSEILKQNPDKASVFQQVQTKGANSSQILSEILKQNQPSEQYGGQRGFLGTLARFTGVEKLATGIGRTINNMTGQPDELLKLSQNHQEQTQKLVDLLKKPGISEEQKTRIKNILQSNTDYAANVYNDVTTAGLSNKEVLGSAAETALNIGLAGSLNGGAKSFGLAKEVAPGLVKAGVGNALKRVGTKMATGFVAGGALGTAEGFAENKSVGESLKQGLVSGTVGSILGGTLQGASEVVRGLTAPELTKKIYDSGLGVSKKTAQSGKSPSVQLIKDGVVGTAQSVYDRAQGIIDDVDPKINTILQKSNKTVRADAVFASLADGVNKSVGNEGKGLVSATEIKQIIQDSLPQVRTLLGKDTLTLEEANQLRQIMDRTLGDRGFTGATLPFKKDVLYDASNSLRGLVQRLEPETKGLFKQYATQVQTIKALNNEMSKPHVLRHMLSLLSAVGGGLPGFAAGVANEALQTTVAKTGVAVGLDRLGKGLAMTDKSIAANLIKRFGRLGVQNVIKKL